MSALPVGTVSVWSGKRPSFEEWYEVHSSNLRSADKEQLEALWDEFEARDFDTDEIATNFDTLMTIFRKDN